MKPTRRVPAWTLLWLPLTLLGAACAEGGSFDYEEDFGETLTPPDPTSSSGQIGSSSGQSSSSSSSGSSNSGSSSSSGQTGSSSSSSGSGLPGDDDPDTSLPGSSSSAGSSSGGGNTACAEPLINEVRHAGSDDFVELYNPGGCAIELGAYELAYRSKNGDSDAWTEDLFGTLPAHGYVVFSQPGANVSQSVGTFGGGLGGDGGRVALKRSGTLIDALGWGTTANSYVEGTAATASNSGKSLQRIPNGVDTNNNSVDFRASTPTPGAANQ